MFFSVERHVGMIFSVNIKVCRKKIIYELKLVYILIINKLNKLYEKNWIN